MESIPYQVRSCFKIAYCVQWLRCDSVLNAHVLACTLRFKTESALAEYINILKIWHSVPLPQSGVEHYNLAKIEVKSRFFLAGPLNAGYLFETVSK